MRNMRVADCQFPSPFFSRALIKASSGVGRRERS